MTEPPPASASDAVPARGRLAKVIPHRPKVGALTTFLLSLVFAGLFSPVVLVDRWIDAPVVAGEPAPITVRVPPFSGYQAPGISLRGGAILVARGEVVTPAQELATAEFRASQPRGAAPFYAYLAIALALTMLYTLHLRRTNRGRLLRVQIVHLGAVLAMAIVAKAALLATSMSVLVIPVALTAVVPTLVYDRTVGLATGVWASLLLSFLAPFDVGVSTVMVVQAAAAALLIPERHRHPWRLALLAGVVAAGAAALTYGAFSYLSTGAAPFQELAHPSQSGWAAAAIGGLIAAVAAVPLAPLYQLLVGEITQGALIRHEDLSHPLLRQIAENAPGTWQHSLAMANMAEIAANSIGANGRLVRVGAYFHDLGKSLQPKYFIENLEPGEQSPHDRLPPEVSCDAIFAHVTEGIAVARRHKLPERLVDFMHMHHGNGVLEYFWAKCKEQGNPKELPLEAFRYPGVPPQSRETAILAICDAVEAASRTLKKPDDRAIKNLVQRIVYGKLDLGQLDESGLSMADLRRISVSLRETIKHAHHGRIEYPWQREEAEAEAGIAETVAIRPAARAATTQRFLEEPRLDSLDAPRPVWASRPRTEADGRGEDVGIATTQNSGRMSAAADDTPVPTATAATARMPTPVPVAVPAMPTPVPVAVPATPTPASAMPAEPAPEPTAASSTPTLAVSPAALAAEAATRLRPAAPSEPTLEMPAARPPAELLDEAEEERTTARVPLQEPPAPAATAPAPAATAAPSDADLTRPRTVSDRAVTTPDPRWVRGLAERVDAALADEEPDPGDAWVVVEPARRGPSTAEMAALSDAIGGGAAPASAAPRARPPAPAAPLDPPPPVPTPVPDTARATPPPPPGARPLARPPSEQEVDGDDIEATIELQPTARTTPAGAVVGPPPATRPNRTGAIPVIEDDRAPARPPSSMLPPRGRGRRSHE